MAAGELRNLGVAVRSYGADVELERGVYDGPALLGSERGDEVIQAERFGVGDEIKGEFSMQLEFGLVDGLTQAGFVLIHSRLLLGTESA